MEYPRSFLFWGQESIILKLKDEDDRISILISSHVDTILCPAMLFNCITGKINSCNVYPFRGLFIDLENINTNACSLQDMLKEKYNQKRTFVCLDWRFIDA